MSVYRKEVAYKLERSLKSIWDDQTRKPDQVILVEDGPLSPELYTVIERWKGRLGEKLVIPKNENNEGLASALNKGLQYVTSDFVARNDTDDYSSPRRFEIQGDYLEKNKEIDVLGGAIQEFDDNNPCLSIRYYPNVDINRYICKATPVAHPSVMMRMSLFREGGLKYDIRYPSNEDIALWFDVLRQGYTISNLQDVIYFFDRSEGVFERRNHSKAGPEFCVYIRGIKDLYGLFTWRYVFPVLRLLFRMMPVSIIKRVYSSKYRNRFLSN